MVTTTVERDKLWADPKRRAAKVAAAQRRVDAIIEARARSEREARRLKKAAREALTAGW